MQKIIILKTSKFSKALQVYSYWTHSGHTLIQRITNNNQDIQSEYFVGLIFTGFHKMLQTAAQSLVLLQVVSLRKANWKDIAVNPFSINKRKLDN